MALNGYHWEELDVSFADTRGWSGSDEHRFRLQAAYVDGKFWLHMVPKRSISREEYDALNAHQFDILLDHEQMAALIQLVLETETEAP